MLYRFISKLVHTLIGHIYYVPCKKGIDQNSVTYVSMATKYPIIKQNFLQNLKKIISANNENISGNSTTQL